ncbi:MAG: DUF1588 domain-containing protein, partial [Myxococcales bacterium]
GVPLLLLALVGGAGCGGGGHSAPVLVPPPACMAGDPGPAPLRRLTRFEVGHALADTLGVDPALAELLPPDELSLGYDNNASAYSVSASHALKTLDMAERAAAMFVSDASTVRAVAGCDPQAPGDHDVCTAAFVRALGGKLWRRPVEDNEVAVLVALADSATEGEPATGLSALVAVLLQAPDFLYRLEPRAPGDQPLMLDGTTLATRLSYLITSAGPDDRLLAHAADGTLATTAGVQSEAERLLASPHALESFQHFVTGWWELGSLPMTEKDTNLALYRSWTPNIRKALSTETAAFLGAAWQDGPTLDRLLRAPRTFADGDLARFYGDPVPTQPGFQPVTPQAGRSAGLLTQGAFLATHAKANQTSPVLRGKFVRTQLFCAPPPPPPPNLVITPPSVNPRFSTRERFQQHTADPFCASCHTLMDPIGFAFEHFDAAGRWRDTDGDKPVDAEGTLTGTDVDGPLHGLTDLADRLSRSGQVRACVATQWFRWAFGRDEQTADDLCTVGVLASALDQAGGDLRSLVRATVTTSTFLTARPAEISGEQP